MEIELVKNDLLRSEVVMTHKGQTLLWTVSPFDRTELAGTVDVFYHINAYWSKLPVAQQDEIFALYSSIRYSLEEAVSLDSLTSELQPMIAKLLDEYHNLDNIEHWMNFYSNINIPSSVQETFDFTDGSPTTAEKTYLVSDYKKLVALSIALRSMIPIWGEFIFRTRAECGTTFKEYYASRLLNHSTIITSPAMVKLGMYVENQLPPDRSAAGAILGGISSDDYGHFMLSRVLVRRLCIGDISGVGEQPEILKFIYKYIRQKNSGQKSGQRSGSSGNFADTVREKFPESGGDSDDGENRLSKFECYKIQEQLPRGEVIMLRHFMNDAARVAAIVEPALDPRLLEESLESVKILETKIIAPAQITLLQWVLKRAISPRGLATVNKTSLLKAIAVTQAVLWHRNHKELAALCSGYEIQHGDHQIATVESRSRITRELHEELRKLFPYHTLSGGRTKTARIINPAIVAIDKVADGLGETEWTLSLPDSWITLLDPELTNRRYAAPYDIKIKLATLVIELVKKPTLTV